MAKEIRIPVPEGIITHGGIVHEIILKEPSVETYLELGDIVTIARAPDGSTFWVENGEILRAYIARCLVQPRDPLAISQCSLRIGRAIKGSVLDFFRTETSAGEASPTQQTTSSSVSSPAASQPTP